MTAAGAAELYARLVVRLRYAVVAAWIGIAVVATTVLPGLVEGGDDLGFVGLDNPAVATEVRSFELFGFPLLSRTVLVQRDPDGLAPAAQAKALLRGIGVSQGSYDAEPILGALPVPNTLGLFPGAQERDTTVLTYLFLPPSTGFAAQQEAAAAFAREHLDDPSDAYVGVTGSIPARAAQAELVEQALPLVELATVAGIALVVAVAFRSLAAPVLTLIVAGSAVVVTLPVVDLLGSLLGVSVPSDIRPVMVALLLGIVTDYAVFFLSSLRAVLRSGGVGRAAVVMATARTTPIVVVAGVTVTAGTGVLVVAESALFRGFGPAMALSVLVGLVVAVTLVPALMAVLGRHSLWPGGPDPAPGTRAAAVTSPLAVALTQRRTAAVVTAACVAALSLASLPLLDLRLGLGFVASLPDDAPVSVAADQARLGFADGIVAPTELLLEADGIGRDPFALSALGDALAEEPGVASVVGPGFLPVPDEYDVFVTEAGDAARYLLVWDSPALSAGAISDLRALRDRLPALLADVGLEAPPRLAGDTALSSLVVQDTTDDLWRISVAALAVNLLMLVLFLRALLTSLALLAASVLALGASLGVTVLVFQDLLGAGELTFYVPFAAAVLLVSLGSDYNIFAVGSVWDHARELPLLEAIRVAVPQTTRAIAAAGMALAVSFGLLALVPLRPFRELAFAMVLGILLDALVVRSLLVPALLTLLGDRARPRRDRTAWQSARRVAEAS